MIEQKHHEPSHNHGFKLSSRSSFKSYSENNNDSDQHFCTPPLMQSRTATSRRASSPTSTSATTCATSTTPPSARTARARLTYFSTDAHHLIAI